MTGSGVYVLFTLDEQRYALRLSAVERVVPIVEIVPLPKAPDIVLGVINIAERVIPVVNIRRRFGLPEREISLSDQLIIAPTSKRTVALVVDRVVDVMESPKHMVVGTKRILSGVDYVEGVIKLDDGLILIHDLETFLSLEEEEALDTALKARKGKKKPE
jgi:purine-binding chemotaxis protein CheW